MDKLIDHTGQRFGLLTVIERADNYVTPKGQKLGRWLCQCDCGKKTTVIGSDLRKGKTKSCGCLRMSSQGKKHTHMKAHTRLYKIWCGMKERCNNPHSKAFMRYGGRGIAVCDEWSHDFQKFWDWSMENGYTDTHSIDRIDNNMGYSPNNCRWVTMTQQANNKRNNRLFVLDGEIKTLTAWCRCFNLNYSTVKTRLDRYGGTIEEALDLAPRKK